MPCPGHTPKACPSPISYAISSFSTNRIPFSSTLSSLIPRLVPWDTPPNAWRWYQNPTSPRFSSFLRLSPHLADRSLKEAESFVLVLASFLSLEGSSLARAAQRRTLLELTAPGYSSQLWGSRGRDLQQLVMSTATSRK